MRHQEITPELLDGAKIIIDRMKDPATFLEFVSEALDWVSEYEIEFNVNANNSRQFDLKCLIDKIIIPWMRSSNCPKADIAEGLYGLIDMYGHEGFDETCTRVLLAFGNECKNYMVSSEFYDRGMVGINTLAEVRKKLFEHNEQKRALSIPAA